MPRREDIESFAQVLNSLGDEPAILHDRRHLLAEIRSRGDLVAEHLSRAHMGQGEALGDDRCLCALAAAGWSEEDGDQRMKPLYWRMNSCVSICFMVSSATPTTMSIAVPPR